MKDEETGSINFSFPVSKQSVTGLHPLSYSDAYHAKQSSLQDVKLAIIRGHAEGRARFGDLGLSVSTYANRIQAIVSKNLGRSPSPDRIVPFLMQLHFRDLYLATACAQESIGFAQGSPDGHPEFASIAWRAMQTRYSGFICNLARFGTLQGFLAQDIADDLFADLFMPDRLSDQSKPANEYHLKTGQRELVPGR